jgi:hypothetical protein
VKANVALNVCNASLGVVLRDLLDARASRQQADDFTARDRRPVRLINRA